MYILKNITAISAIAFALLFTSCTKSDDADDDVTGNWVRRSDFEGVARSDRVRAGSNRVQIKPYACKAASFCAQFLGVR